MRTSTVLLLSSLVWFPRAAMACATCYGAADAPQTHAMNAAIFSLLGVVTTMLSLFAAFFVYLMIRAKTVAKENAEMLKTDQMEMGQLVEVNAHE